MSPFAHPRESALSTPSEVGLALLHDVSRELSSILHPETLLRRVADLVKELIDCQLFGVLLYDPDAQELTHAVSVSHNGLPELSIDRSARRRALRYGRSRSVAHALLVKRGSVYTPAAFIALLP